MTSQEQKHSLNVNKPSKHSWKTSRKPYTGQQGPLCSGRKGNLRMTLTENCKEIKSTVLDFAFPFSPCVTFRKSPHFSSIISVYKGVGAGSLHALIEKHVLSTYYLQYCSKQDRYSSKQNEQESQIFYYNRKMDPLEPMSSKILRLSKASHNLFYHA